MTTTPASNNHIPGILTLQSKYLFVNLSADERKKGFVTTPFTEAQIEEVIKDNGLFVALDDSLVVGYAFAGTWEYFTPWPIFPFMIDRLTGQQFGSVVISESNTFQYGPVCIDEAYRGSGLFNQLFEEMRLSMRERFSVGLTFINQVNTHSYYAHTRKLGMQVIDSFSFNGNVYDALGFDTSKTVL
ncbi:MAG: GNAT family acetyltransferase [Saprospiraceae bacterium]|nr:GNAT family acetyltransferase [Saprospiraceae bacterium]